MTVAEWFYRFTVEIGTNFNNSIMTIEHTEYDDIVTGVFIIWFMFFIMLFCVLLLFILFIINKRGKHNEIQ